MELIYKRYMGAKTIYYYNEFMSLDIETSHNQEYTWISSIQVYFLGEYHLFRNAYDLIDYLKELISKYNLCYHIRLMIIIHNASYDLSYLIGYFQKYLPDKNDRSVLKRDRNNTISYRQGGLEFRDTYALVNTSLEKWGKDLNIEHKKKVGFYDYSKVIYQDTVLSDQEQQYDQYDVLSLSECFQKQLLIHKDTIATIPFTSTGYVRRDCEKICRSDKYYRQKYFLENKLTLEMFEMCVRGFSGGYTHNNRFYNNKIVRGLIGHRDFTSMYPSELRNYPLPFGKPRIIYDITDKLKSRQRITIQDIFNLYPRYSSITLIEIFEASIKDPENSMPFMQHSKMNVLETNHCIKDNGRVLSFAGKAFMCVDNLLLRILTEQYKMKMRICKVLTFKNELLPRPLVELIDRYFKDKSDLKTEAARLASEYGELDNRTVEANINLMLSKGKLNGIYGMFVQNPLQDEFDINYDKLDFIEVKSVVHMTKEEKEKQLEDFYNNRHKVLPYQVGVFVTALARYELYEYIKIIGYKNVLYCDTDSIFYIKNEEIEKKIEDLNHEKRIQAVKNGAYIDTNEGKRIYYDNFDQETDLKAFKGLHSKCYSYINIHDEFRATIAGVPARSIIGMQGDTPIYITREEELAGIKPSDKLANPEIKIDNEAAMDNLQEGFTFLTNTGTTCNYAKYMLHNDYDIKIDGHYINTFGGALISKLESKQIKDMDLEGIEVRKGDFA